MSHDRERRSRRGFLRVVSIGSAAALVGCGAQRASSEEQSRSAGGERGERAEIPPTPSADLMREHGVIERLLLVYEDGVHRIDEGRPLDAEVLHEAARLQREFTEDYHERLEEEFVFPRLRQAGHLTGLVDTLRTQHDVGRQVTDTILDATRGSVGDPRMLRAAMQSYVTMYVPHAAREDTVAFPALAKLLSEREQHDMAERFEDLEHQRFGEHGFESVVQGVAQLEDRIGIANLAMYTPDPSAIRQLASAPTQRRGRGGQ